MEKLKEKLALLIAKKSELRKKTKTYKEEVKPLRTEINALTDEITAMVLNLGHSVSIEGITAEYKPQVIIKLDKKKKAQ